MFEVFGAAAVAVELLTTLLPAVLPLLSFAALFGRLPALASACLQSPFLSEVAAGNVRKVGGLQMFVAL